MKYSVRLRHLGLCEYAETWQNMQNFTNRRDENTQDEIWILEHPPVFTLGQAGKHEHVLAPGNIPLVQTDRGGQVTYHGPGQIVAYLLVDLRRKNIGVRALVDIIEQSLIECLQCYKIEAYPKKEAPGVYVDEAKIASIGLRVRHGCSYHGLSFNVSMDLEPFSRINPCGYKGLAVTQLSNLLAPMGKTVVMDEVETILIQHLTNNLGYTVVNEDHD